ncbi:TonB-dependent receptor [Fulvivirga sp. M361]|uniref:SusC/RagA family TonB-linked outer membrane protein n=1 Tax=Fulvivirga sp. M361 TaxID=2594266 RepID=UPI00117B7046|nr:TonB-dependent receptor [Fulvivirga sp. M361]TRX60043.1 TonB-dependent receptor [Fulvivirga sp. M361]
MKIEALQRIKKLMKLASYGIICQILIINTITANNLSAKEIQQASDIQVSGKVLDENGESLPGVNVLIKGTTNGTVTDFDGNYNIQVPEDGTLVFSYVGYARQEININNRTVIDVNMELDASQLGEIIVIGYGETKKEDVTGSLGAIDTERIERRVSVNPLDNLQGEVAGVNVVNTSGRPGGGINVLVRGITSISATNQPLYVIDGIIDADISQINTNDIESITVLKDASATAIYGFIASNGVVIVTTKRGTSEGVTLDVNYNLQVGRLTNKPEVLNSQEYWGDLKPRVDQQLRDIGADDGFFTDNYAARFPLLFNPSDAESVYGDPRFDTDWLDESTRTSVSHQYFANLRAGGENYALSFSVGSQDDEGIVLNTSLEKNTMRFNGDYYVKDWLKVGGSLSYAETKTNRVDDYRVGADGLTYASLFYLPIYPTRYDDGSVVNADDLVKPNGQWDVWYGRTPSERLNMLTRESKTTQLLRNVFVEIDFLKNLKFRTALSQEQIENDGNTHVPKELDTFVNRTSATVSNSEFLSTQWENTLNYNTQFGADHDLNILAGASWYSTESFAFSASGQDFDDFFRFYNLAQSDDEFERITSGQSESKAVSFFGRANYTYKGKYLVTATGRYDGSSRFGANNEFAFFPSAAVGWRISEEGFLKDNSTMSNLKLRASWGKTGNSNIPNFQRFGQPGQQNAIFGGRSVNSTSQGRIGNDDLKWEVTTETNVGLDIGLFDRVNLTFDYYTKESDDLLLGIPIARFTGYSNIFGNAGSLQNRGIELGINSQNIATNDFSWNTSLNFARNVNEVTSLGIDDSDFIRSVQFGGFNEQIFRVGEAAGSFYGYNRLGTWNIGEEDEAAIYGAVPGDIRIEDVNDDDVIDSEDLQIIGNGLPDFTLNIGNTFTYKNFALSFDIRVVQGSEIVDYSVLLNVDRQGYGNTYREFFQQAWTPENQNTMYPRVRRDLKFFRGIDTGHVFDASFIRGQNLSLSYDFNTNIVERIGLGGAQIYLNFQNWFLITDYHGYDPEASSYNDEFFIGYELNGYPKALITNIGIRANF